ncbi:MAG: recombinase family protein [Phycisphaerae bacterium]|jgi:site-specific DNA recombinase
MSSFANKLGVLKKEEIPEGAIAIYARVSTEEMAKGDSIENQIEACRNFITAHPDVFENREIRIYSDPAHTGKTFDRPDINRLWRDKETVKTACILGRDLKRLGRNTKEGLEFLDAMTAANIQIIDIGQPSIDYRTTKGRKIFTDAMSGAEAERGIYRDNSIQGQTKRAQKGQWKGGPPPYACDLEAGILLPVWGPPTELLQEMAAVYEEHKSYLRVLTELNKQGIKYAPITPRVCFDRERARRGFVSRRPENTGKPQLITLRWIAAVLQNPVYAGFVPAPRAVNGDTVRFAPDLVLPDGRRYFKSEHQTIFPLPQWEKIQAIRRGQTRTNTRAGRPSTDYLLQQLLQCGCCQLPLNVGASTSGSGKSIRHYACRSMKQLGTQSKCTVRRVPAEAMETVVMRFLSDLPKRPDLIDGITALASKNKEGLTQGLEERAALLEKERAALERTKKNTIDRMLEFAGKKIGTEMEQRYNEVQAKLDAVILEMADLRRKREAAHAAAPSAQVVVSALADFGKLAAQLPASAMKELVQLLVAEIVVHRLNHRSMPQFKHLPASSSILKLDITLNPCGLHMISSPSKGSVAAKTKGGQPKLVPTTFVVEIRQAGNKGNVVRLLEPFATEAEVYAFPSKEASTEEVARAQHPLWRMEAMVAMRAKGMLKKDIAAKFGKKPSWVTYHLRLCGLRSGIQQKLKAAPLSVLGQFGLVYLMRLAVMEPELQEKTFDEAFRKALHTDTVVRPIKTVPESPADDTVTNA